MPARTRLDFMLSQAGTLQRATHAPDASGGATRTWSDVGGAVKCLVADAATEVQARYAQQKIVVTHAIYMREDPGARSGDRFVVGAVSYAIKGVMSFPGGNFSWENVCQLDVERVI